MRKVNGSAYTMPNKYQETAIEHNTDSKIEPNETTRSSSHSLKRLDRM